MSFFDWLTGRDKKKTSDPAPISAEDLSQMYGFGDLPEDPVQLKKTNPYASLGTDLVGGLMWNRDLQDQFYKGVNRSQGIIDKNQEIDLKNAQIRQQQEDRFRNLERQQIQDEMAKTKFDDYVEDRDRKLMLEDEQKKRTENLNYINSVREDFLTFDGKPDLDKINRFYGDPALANAFYLSEQKRAKDDLDMKVLNSRISEYKDKNVQNKVKRARLKYGDDDVSVSNYLADDKDALQLFTLTRQAELRKKEALALKEQKKKKDELDAKYNKAKQDWVKNSYDDDKRAKQDKVISDLSKLDPFSAQYKLLADSTGLSSDVLNSLVSDKQIKDRKYAENVKVFNSLGIDPSKNTSASLGFKDFLDENNISIRSEDDSKKLAGVYLAKYAADKKEEMDALKDSFLSAYASALNKKKSEINFGDIDRSFFKSKSSEIKTLSGADNVLNEKLFKMNKAFEDYFSTKEMFNSLKKNNKDLSALLDRKNRFNSSLAKEFLDPILLKNKPEKDYPKDSENWEESDPSPFVSSPEKNVSLPKKKYAKNVKTNSGRYVPDKPKDILKLGDKLLKGL